MKNMPKVMASIPGMSGGLTESPTIKLSMREYQDMGVKVGDKVFFACVDGPDFDGHEVDFDDLMQRLRRYAPAEKRAMEHWRETCRMRNAQP